MRKKQVKHDPFKDTLHLYLKFMQVHSPTFKRALLLAKLERGITFRISAEQLWAEALNCGLDCEADFRAAGLTGVFEVSAQGVKTIKA